MGATKICPACGAAGVAVDRLTCRPCWYRVPVRLRHEVNAAWRAYQRARHRHPGMRNEALLAALKCYRQVADEAVRLAEAALPAPAPAP